MALCYCVPDAVELCGCDDPVGRHRGRGGPTDSPRVEQCTLCRALGQGCKDPKPLRPIRKVLCRSECSVTEQGSRQSNSTLLLWLLRH